MYKYGHRTVHSMQLHYFMTRPLSSLKIQLITLCVLLSPSRSLFLSPRLVWAWSSRSFAQIWQSKERTSLKMLSLNSSLFVWLLGSGVRGPYSIRDQILFCVSGKLTLWLELKSFVSFLIRLHKHYFEDKPTATGTSLSREIIQAVCLDLLFSSSGRL